MKKALVTILLLLLAAALVTGGLLGYNRWYRETHIFVGNTAYALDADRMDLRGQAISVEHYESLRQQLPDCEIRWDVPFQGGYVADDTAELTISTLSQEDVAMLRYLPELRKVDATACQDYDALLALREQYPEVSLSYQVTVGGETLSGDTAELTLTEVDTAELAEKLAYLPEMETVHIVEPTVPAEELVALREQYPEVTISWVKTVFDQTYTDDVTELDFSDMPMETVDEVEAAMTYFPSLEKLILCNWNVENDVMAEYRDRVRENYKVVWSVKVCGVDIRTDETYFMPVKYGIKVRNNLLENLVYCEDMLCVDLGHKYVTDLSWVKGMPHLKYLIVADGPIQDLTPLSDCKELVFLELFDNWVSDFTPLYGCTALEDLNVSDSSCGFDLKQLGEMTWLKNLWCSLNSATKEERAYLEEHLPNTNIMFDGYTSTSGGWRELENYYGMRDLLEMPYNPW